MRPFRFRAASALELRKKQEDQARLALGHAQKVAALTAARLETALGQVAESGVRLAGVQAQGAPAWLIGWHRSWIVKQSRDVDVCRREAGIAAAAAAQAGDVVREAHKKRRVLERLRERLSARHAREIERQDLQHMNELAGLRYLIGAAERKEQQ